MKAKNEFENFIFSSDSTQIQNIKKQKFDRIYEISNYKQTVSRDIEFGLKELIFDLTFVYTSDNTLKYSKAEIHQFYFKNRPIGNLIIYPGKDKTHSKKFLNSFQDYLNAHNIFYKTNYDLDNFIKDISNKQIYGNGCGYEMATVKKVDGIELRTPENAEKYVDWMKSFSMEKQMWGYSQIQYLLKNDFIQINGFEEKIYNHVRTRNAVLETCSGCTFGIFERAFNK